MMTCIYQESSSDGNFDMLMFLHLVGYSDIYWHYIGTYFCALTSSLISGLTSKKYSNNIHKLFCLSNTCTFHKNMSDTKKKVSHGVHLLFCGIQRMAQGVVSVCCNLNATDPSNKTWRVWMVYPLVMTYKAYSDLECFYSDL